ncbi:BTAD domain-containing putative transcriptional regulator [Nonomuraea ferruginea]
MVSSTGGRVRWPRASSSGSWGRSPPRATARRSISVHPAEQALTAILAAWPGRVVPIPRIIDGIWGDDPPKTAEQSVYTYVAGLRNALEPSRGRREPSKLVVGAAGGYRLRLDGSRVDAIAFTERLDHARRAVLRGDHAGALPDLEEALALWHGEALPGVPGPFAESERARLTEARLAAQEYRAEALLGLDRPQDALAPLRAMTYRHPLRERPRELLMLALVRCGRRAEALVVYEESRRLLREELGVDPGEALRRSHRLALAAGPRERPGDGPPPLPRQLPRDLAGFVGRTQEVIRLKGLLAPWDDTEPNPLVVISGPPGVGKSALAVRIGNLVKDRYPDGQLYVNLRGATVGLPGLDPLDVLGRFLRAFGIDGDAIPGDVDEAAALWRSTLSGRRTLILLDDAAGLGQILPLLPAPRGTAIVVTSRETLAAGDDCVQLHLPRLSLPESVTVLAKLAGAERMAADPEETAGLVRLCDGLPLALRIAGARLADRPAWSVSALTGRAARRAPQAARAGGGRAGGTGEPGVELERPGRQRQADRPGRRPRSGSARPAAPARRDGGGGGGAARHRRRRGRAGAGTAGGRPPAGTPRGPGPLPAPRPGPAVRGRDGAGRRRRAARPGAELLHRLRAAGRHHHGPAPGAGRGSRGRRRAARRRRTGRGDRLAGRARRPTWWRRPGRPWLAPDSGLAALGVALCFSLFWYQQYAHEPVPLIALNRRALDVCERLGDRLGAYHAHGHVACGLALQGKAEAMGHLEAQLILARELGDRFSEQRTLGNLANLSVERGLHEQALGYAGRQLALARRIGADVGVRYALMMRGLACQKLGRPAEARGGLWKRRSPPPRASATPVTR